MTPEDTAWLTAITRTLDEYLTETESAAYLEISFVTFTSLRDAYHLKPVQVREDGTRLYNKRDLDRIKGAH